MGQVGAEEEASALRDRVGLAADDQLELALEHVADLLAVMLERTAHLAVGGKADDEAFKQPDIGKRPQALRGPAVALDDAAAGLARPLGRAVDHAGLFLGLRQERGDADIERPAQPVQRGERGSRAIVLDARQQAGRARRPLGEIMQGELLDATKVTQPAAEGGNVVRRLGSVGAPAPRRMPGLHDLGRPARRQPEEISCGHVVASIATLDAKLNRLLAGLTGAGPLQATSRCPRYLRSGRTRSTIFCRSFSLSGEMKQTPAVQS